MSTYRVTFNAIASAVITVEAESETEAIEAAYEMTPAGNQYWPDMGDWALPSEMFDWATSADDVEEV